jgi:hypothetical protein
VRDLLSLTLQGATGSTVILEVSEAASRGSLLLRLPVLRLHVCALQLRPTDRHPHVHT